MNLRDLDIGGVRPFDVNSDLSSVATEWKRWLLSFQLYADGKGLIIVPDKDDNKVQRRALLLHCAGPDVQDIFDVLADTGSVKDYQKADDSLTILSHKLTLHMSSIYSEKWCKGKMKRLINLRCD